MKDTWAIEIEITKDTCVKNIQGEIIKHLNRCPFTLHSHPSCHKHIPTKSSWSTLLRFQNILHTKIKVYNFFLIKPVKLFFPPVRHTPHLGFLASMIQISPSCVPQAICMSDRNWLQLTGDPHATSNTCTHQHQTMSLPIMKKWWWTAAELTADLQTLAHVHTPRNASIAMYWSLWALVRALFSDTMRVICALKSPWLHVCTVTWKQYIHQAISDLQSSTTLHTLPSPPSPDSTRNKRECA